MILITVLKLFSWYWTIIFKVCKASHAQICVLFIRLNDLLRSLGRQNMFFILSLWSSMISLTKPRSFSMIVNDLLKGFGRCKMFFYFLSLIVNDILQSLGRPNMCLFRLYDRQWTLTKPRSPKYESYMALHDHEWSFMKPRSPKCVSYLNSMMVNVLLKSLGRPNMFILFPWWSDSMISYKASVAQICVLFTVNDLQWSLSKPRSPKYVFFYLLSMIVNDLLQSLGRPNTCLI